MKNILMIDIETTGTRAGCRVLTLGAFGFDTHCRQVEFYTHFNIKDQVGLFDEASTMEWWSRQAADVRDEAFAGAENTVDGIVDFLTFFENHFSTERGSNFQVWSCGIDFDMTVLKELFKVFGHVLPWPFWCQYDYRTIKNLFPCAKAAEANIDKHNSLEDAKAQMRGLRSFYKTFIEKA